MPAPISAPMRGSLPVAPPIAAPATAPPPAPISAPPAVLDICGELSNGLSVVQPASNRTARPAMRKRVGIGSLREKLALVLLRIAATGRRDHPTASGRLLAAERSLGNRELRRAAMRGRCVGWMHPSSGPTRPPSRARGEGY